LQQILIRTESMLGHTALKKGLKFAVQTYGDLPTSMCTDAYRLQQCLVNLVSNAIKFTDHGHVLVNVSLEDKHGLPHVRFDVEDTGIGVPAEKQQKIFASFTQADNSTTRQYGGTGLGLALTKQLAELLGGELSAWSVEGTGSVFTLSIPAGVEVTKQPSLQENVAQLSTGETKHGG